MREEDFEGGNRVAHVVGEEVGGVEVYADVGAVEFLEEKAEGFGGFLSGFEADVDSVGGEGVGDFADPVDEDGEFRVGFGFGEEAGVEGDEREFQIGGDLSDEGGVGAVLFPGFVGNEAAGAADGFEGGVVLAFGFEHSRDDFDAGGGGVGGDGAPDFGVEAEGIEGELDAGESGGLDFGDEVGRVFRAEGPAANGETVEKILVRHDEDFKG